jgi:ribosomal protein S18 acetylase RimI-like enzyme
MLNVIKLADPTLAGSLHEILHEAFRPYIDLYTPGAFSATVVSADILQARIASENYCVYGCYVDYVLAGTVSTKLNSKGDLYFMSMAVSPAYSGVGIGTALLKAIENEAQEKRCGFIILETYAPLLDAIRLYEKNGYRRTGNQRDYSGIVIFEMEKTLLKI